MRGNFTDKGKDNFHKMTKKGIFVIEPTIQSLLILPRILYQ